jgi:hypothetical protein
MHGTADNRTCKDTARATSTARKQQIPFGMTNKKGRCA